MQNIQIFCIFRKVWRSVFAKQVAETPHAPDNATFMSFTR